MHKSAVLGITLILVGPGAFEVWDQTGAAGTINVTVLDVRRAATQRTGAFDQDDAGVAFNNLTLSQLQSSVGVKHARSPWFYFLEFLNVFNHPTWRTVLNGAAAASVQSLTFGQTMVGPTGPRVIEFRLNLEF